MARTAVTTTNAWRRTGATIARAAVRIAVAIVLPGIAALPEAAVNVAPSAADTQRALRLAGGAEASRARFHAPYTVAVKDSVIRDIQVLTEFRRTVMAAEEARKRGDWAVSQGAHSLSGGSVESTVRPWRGKVTVVANLQLDALHTYVTTPACEVMIGGMPVLASLDRRTTPLSSLSSSSGRTMITSLVGAVIEADFDAGAVGQTSRPVMVLCDGREVARAPLDFSQLE
jgi:hypothetical protein